MTPTLDQYLESYRRDSASMVEAARGNLDARVPGCPDWDVRTLVQHTGDVLYRWGTTAEERRRERGSIEVPDPPADEEALLGWFAGIAQRTHDILRDADPTTPVWTWASRKDIGFIQRRMPQELSVHAWDARSAREQEPSPIPAVIAADGIDEYFDTFCAAYLDEGADPPADAGTLHLHQTDGDGEWFVRYGPDGVSFSKEHAKGDTAVRAGASDLVLMLWRRIPTDSDVLEIHGDKSKLDGFLGWLDLT